MIDPIAGGIIKTINDTKSDEFNRAIETVKSDVFIQSPNDDNSANTAESKGLEGLWNLLDRLSRGKALNPSGAPQIRGEYDGEDKASMALKAARTISGLEQALQFAKGQEKEDILAQIDEVKAALKDAGIELSDYLDYTPQYGYSIKTQFAGIEPDVAKASIPL